MEQKRNEQKLSSLFDFFFFSFFQGEVGCGEKFVRSFDVKEIDASIS